MGGFDGSGIFIGARKRVGFHLSMPFHKPKYPISQTAFISGVAWISSLPLRNKSKCFTYVLVIDLIIINTTLQTLFVCFQNF